MKKTIIKELIWLAGIFVLSVVAFEFIQSSFAFDISLHDTYIHQAGYTHVLSVASLLLSYFVTISFWIYFIRATYRSFKIIIVDVLLMISSATMIFFYNNGVSSYDVFVINEFLNNDNVPVKGLFYGGDISIVGILILYVIKILFVVVFGFSAYMIGKNRNKTSTTENL